MSTYKKIFMLGGFLLLFTSCFFVRAKVTGRVMMLMPSGSSAPLADAKVELWTTGGKYLDTATIDMEGNFIFPGYVAMGNYILWVKPSGFLGFKEKKVPLKVYRSIVHKQVLVEAIPPG